MADKFASAILVLIIIFEIVYIGLIPYNIDKTSTELEKIRKCLEEISSKMR